MFGIDFYPTPPQVIEQMIGGIDLSGKVVLEPSAGSGNLVDAIKAAGAKEILACEIDPKLRKVLAGKVHLIADDCLTVTSEQVSHVDFIIANPPFSKAVDHLLHLYNIAPAGCKIIALSNLETVKRPHTTRKTELASIINTCGHWQDLGECFTTAERTTDVEVALIVIDKPGADYNQEFEGFFMDDEPEAQANGIMSYNVVRDLVNRYVGAIKIFDQQIKTAVRLNELTSMFCEKTEVSVSFTREEAPITRNQFKKELQKSAWSWIFEKMNLEKYSTRGLREDINKFVERQEQVPFTMRNIYRMIDIVIGTASSRIDKAVLEVFDQFTKHHHENRHGVEGWQTNSHYILNKKFITGYLVGIGWHGEVVTSWSGGNVERIDDMVKALCFLTGTKFETVGSFYHAVQGKGLEWGKWHEWGFFKIRPYKKGSVHFEFLDEQVWRTFNERVAQLKGYPLPENKKQTKWQQRRKAA